MSRTIFLLAFTLLLHGAVFGELVCEELPVELCSLSIASSGKRCLLETSSRGSEGLECKTSEVMANMRGYIESDDCANACGVHRTSVGISSDSLLETQFTHKLCSPECYDNCPNIVDLYNNLAQAEGVFLPELCKSEGTSSHRVMLQLQSSGAAYGPKSAAAYGPKSAAAEAPMTAITPSHRFMLQLQSSGAAAKAPITAIANPFIDCAPTSM